MTKVNNGETPMTNDWHRDPNGAVYLVSYRYKGKRYSGTITAESWNDASRKCAAKGLSLSGLADVDQYPGVHND